LTEIFGFEVGFEAPVEDASVVLARAPPHTTTKCKDCSKKIIQGSVRIQFNGSFYHPECFLKTNVSTVPVHMMQGYFWLSENEKESLNDILLALAAQNSNDEGDDEESPNKKPMTKKRKLET